MTHCPQPTLGLFGSCTKRLLVHKAWRSQDRSGSHDRAGEQPLLGFPLSRRTNGPGRASDILGVSGRAMLAALVQGTTDHAVLADLARGRLRGKLPALRQALASRFRPHHAFVIGQLLAHLDYLDEAIGILSGQVETMIAP